MSAHLQNLQQILKRENLSDIVINTFTKYYQMVESGATGILTKDEIFPPDDNKVESYSDLNNNSSINLNKLAVIKLNGGLGTSMGLKKAKSLLPVKDNHTFLDIIVNQILSAREEYKSNFPLIFMDSFNTTKDTLEYLKKYKNLKLNDLPLDFVQNKFPKIKQDDFSFLNDDQDKNNWNPPGHGDIYMAMATSGVLDKLLNNGFEYLFVSNSDNLGATLDLKILNHFAQKKLPFMMEVCLRTEADKKGGHLAQTNDGQLLLRETAQCPPEEKGEFEDVNIYKYFNTNNLWINLKALKDLMNKNNNLLILPLIRNGKEVNGTKVYQIETAMGSAISVFKNSGALKVPRSRFAPVKKTNDLLVLWSDAYCLDEKYRMVLNPECSEIPIVELDSNYYKNIEQLQERFETIPSLIDCEKLEVIGDVYFKGDNTITGKLTIDVDEKSVFEDGELK